MRISIIGAGKVGSAIARGLKGTDHEIILGVRDPKSEKISELVSETAASAVLPAEAATQGDIVILALPWAVAEDAVKGLGALDGKIVIDCMNPLGMVDGKLGLLIGHDNSGGEVVQTWLPGAKVVKTLNQVGAELMADNTGFSHRPVMFVAGNDDDAKDLTCALLQDLGFEPLDAGDITKSRILEPFGMVWINQALFRGKGRNWAFTALEA